MHIHKGMRKIPGVKDSLNSMHSSSSQGKNQGGKMGCWHLPHPPFSVRSYAVESGKLKMTHGLACSLDVNVI